MLHIRDSKCVCCKISLLRHVQILCIVDFIFLICSTYYTSVVLANVLDLLTKGGRPPISDNHEDETTMLSSTTSAADRELLSISASYKPPMMIVAAIISSSLQIFLHVIQLILVLALLYGIQKDILSCCKIWFSATILLSVIIAISLVVNLSGKYFVVPTVITALYVAYKCYMLWVVKLYTRRLILYLIHFKQTNDQDLEDVHL